MRYLVGAIVAMVLGTVIVLGMLWAGVRATEADREHRTARVEACRTVEDQALRTLCLAKP